MMASLHLTLAALLLIIVVVNGSIIMQPSYDLMYNQAPRLRIRASGFPADMKSVTLELSVPFEPSLVLYTDYVLSLDPDHEGIVLNLQSRLSMCNSRTRLMGVLYV